MQAQTPLVTVYITNYNYGKYIKQSIESVLCQSLSNFELIIIDDGSTDNSKEIIENYRNHPKIKIIYQQNKGLNITNNIAMRSAKGKYIMRLDADDFLEPNAIEHLSNSLENNPECGLVFPDYYYVDSNGYKIGEERRHNFEKEVSLYDQPAHGACTMIRLSFLRELGGYNESFSCQDGYDLWIKFIMHHKVTNINKPLFSYRRHGSNLTTNELRILTTRKKIKELYVRKHLILPKCIAIIPVRNTFIDGNNWPLVEVNGKSILQHKVESCLKANNLGNVIISAADHDIYSHCQRWIHQYENVILLQRPEHFAGDNETLTKTIDQALAYCKENGIHTEAIMTISLEYPFLSSEVIDDAVNTLTLFNSSCVLSVRPDNHMYYQHTGHTLKPILEQDKFTKLEREFIYKGAGGVVVSTLENFKANSRLVGGRISHIVVDQKTSFGVMNSFDFCIFKALSNETNMESMAGHNMKEANSI